MIIFLVSLPAETKHWINQEQELQVPNSGPLEEQELLVSMCKVGNFFHACLISKHKIKRKTQPIASKLYL